MQTSTLRAATLAALILAAGAGAHELQENRATLVLRDKTHIGVTLYIAYSDALHQVLMPQRPFASFLLIYSAMKPEELQKELLRAQSKFQSETRIYLSPGPGREIPLTNWVWPDVKQVQTMLQQRIMAAMVDPNRHAHDTPIEIRADANSPHEITAVTVRFPEEFQTVLVVSYRPNQVWTDGKALSPEIKF
jgi:hypothetical protein